MTQFNSHAMSGLRTLLIVDDDRSALSTLTSQLLNSGFRVDGVDSTELVNTWLQRHYRPDLVILNLPNQGNGDLETIQALKGICDIPFLLLSASAEQTFVKQASEEGALGYLIKPVNLSQLICSIETALSRATEIKLLKHSKINLQAALASERNVNVAVGILMDQYRINKDEALKLLTHQSRAKQQKMVDIAETIVNSRETLNFGNKL